MKKKYRMIVLTLLVFLTFYGCKKGGPSAQVEISESSFIDGEHRRDEHYGATFSTKSISLDNLKLHFDSSIFDETESPVLARKIVADYTALAEQGEDLAKPVDVYLVIETTTGYPVVTESGLFCTAESVQEESYRPFLASSMFNLTPWWQCIGLSQTVFGERKISSGKMSEHLNAYNAQNEKSAFLTLSPFYFMEEFADAETRELAEQAAQSLTEYILSQYGKKSFLTDGNRAHYRNAWLQKLGIDTDKEIMESPEAADLSSLPFRREKNAPFLVEEQNVQIKLKRVDWMSSADEVFCFLQDFYRDAQQLYRYLEENAPKHYNMLRQPDAHLITVSVSDSDAGDHSYAKLDGSEAIVLNHADALHEFTHCLIPVNASDERRWLSEGLTTYLSVPYLSCEAAPQFVDCFANPEEIAKLSGDYLQASKQIAARYEQITGQNIAEIYKTEQPIYRIYQTVGYEKVLHPETFENIVFPIATMTVDERAGVSSEYAENQLSYAQAMVFTEYLVDKYGLDTMIEAEMDSDAYDQLFPDTAAFQKEYNTFAAQLASEIQDYSTSDKCK